MKISLINVGKCGKSIYSCQASSQVYSLSNIAISFVNANSISLI